MENTKNKIEFAIFWILGVLLVLLSFANYAEAALEQPTLTTAGNFYSFDNTLGQVISTTTLAGSITNLTVNFMGRSYVGATGTVQLSLVRHAAGVECTGLSEGEDIQSPTTVFSGLNQNEPVINGIRKNYSWTFSHDFLAGNCYEFLFFTTSTVDSGFSTSFSGSASSSSYPYGWTNFALTSDPVKDIYFTTSQSSSSITIYDPPNGATTPEFDFWRVYGTTPVDSPLIGIRYGTSSGVYAYEDFTQQSDNAGSAFDFFVLKTQTLVSSSQNATGTLWYSKAFIYDGAGQVVSSSTETVNLITFSFNNINTYREYLIPPFNATGSLAVCGDGNFFDFLSASTIKCYIMSGINEALTNAKNFLSEVGGLVLNVFPLNIISTVHDAFHNSTTTGAFPSDYSTGDITLSGAGLFGGRTFTFIDSETMTDVSNNIGFDAKATLGRFMYLITFGWIAVQSFLVVKHLRKDNEFHKL